MTRLREQITSLLEWIKNRSKPLLTILVTILLLFLAWILWETIRLDNLGFDGYIDPKGEYHRGKTLWDWMELLIIPIVLAIGAWWLNKSERECEREIAEKNRKEDREIANERRNQATLEAYFDRMTELLLKEGLRESPEGDEVRSIARTRTLAVLRSLNGSRKGQVVQFLCESRLIDSGKPVVKLSKADLRGAYLRETNLREDDLSGANLSEANLNKANLSGANLSEAYLYQASLNEADLSSTDLRGAKVTNEQLAQAKSLAGATLPDGTKHD